MIKKLLATQPVLGIFGTAITFVLGILNIGLSDQTKSALISFVTLAAGGGLYATNTSAKTLKQKLYEVAHEASVDTVHAVDGEDVGPAETLINPTAVLPVITTTAVHAVNKVGSTLGGLVSGLLKTTNIVTKGVLGG